MGFTGALKGLILVAMAASMLGVSMANRNRDWTYNYNKTAGWGWGSYHRPNRTDTTSKKIVVGGSDNWHFGVNYTAWASKTAPFYFNDTLGEFTIIYYELRPTYIS